ncbi:3-oxoacyl-[acyl-carrier-protein] synthase, KASII [Pseudonocardia sp. Ae168_Ps1]|uniref:beta-ketoacyl-ACP synthase II n=1 Tax=unclassified Pseudonocardia TaxID=2619320 RepID=UPI00094ACFEE|nr:MULTISPECIES: beta-ketoacyl-ACP synthase II [unclassified Pseudonocardia]OLL74512.1 3-oxoacyl-[acyl-carrier-protein] synthase, KASII [Pseudonocardia sp. Ae150A_Ps1]OLL80492.1 3-oxoacyl-[acyl-carrier-protein] synthase, KASII [Pseudonocardia sp. Ae168_Ps1]OLL85381.1 3-oxoacyl-[acyl-carrier-protein] synthase, KASII [Pseudonocardia sp. Ae263_Ps1]OLL94592.1 3-oxoacyl-[acyl-carrier-protein] synthase, KASII [Pseudonocardia sp. Ae356_Ps1]
MNDRRRVVVTGCGAVTPLGHTVDETWAGLVAGRSGIATISGFDATDLPTTIAGEVRDFDPDLRMRRSVSRRLDVYAQYAVYAALEAVESAKLQEGEVLPERLGVLVGSGYGAVHSIEAQAVTIRERGPARISPYAPITGAIDSAAGEISMTVGARGPSRAISSACATGTDAIGDATAWIRSGRADAVIAGGAEDCLTRIDIAGSGNAKALSRRTGDPTAASRPFDEDRDGFVMSAGAGIVVLEELEHALRRGAPVLAEVAGYAGTSDAHHWTAPHPDGVGVRAAMRAALDDAGVRPDEVDHVNAHGTSTRLNDRNELDCLREVLGARLGEIPLCSVKSMTGHMIGAAGAVEAIAAVRTIGTGVVPPTINCHRPIEDDVDFVAHEAREHDVDVVMSNSFGFGGHNAVLVLRRVTA